MDNLDEIFCTAKKKKKVKIYCSFLSSNFFSGKINSVDKWLTGDSTSTLPRMNPQSPTQLSVTKKKTKETLT